MPLSMELTPRFVAYRRVVTQILGEKFRAMQLTAERELRPMPHSAESELHAMPHSTESELRAMQLES
jgi:hypothetical protein